MDSTLGSYSNATVNSNLGVSQNSGVPSTVIITDVDTDETWADGDIDLVITGSGFTV